MQNVNAQQCCLRLKTVTKKHRAVEVRRIILSPPSGKPLLGQNALVLLHRLLRHSRTLIYSGIRAFESKDHLGLSLAARAHVETLGLLTHLLNSFEKYYQNQVSREVIDDLMERAFLGSAEKLIPNSPRPLKPTKMIAEIDAYVDELFRDTRINGTDLEALPFFQEQYRTLCQYCHPNLAGTASHARVTPNAVEFLNQEEAFHDHNDGIFVLSISAELFFIHWQHFHELLNQFEDLPRTE